MKKLQRMLLSAAIMCAAAMGASAQTPPVFMEDFNDLTVGIPQGWNNEKVTGNYKWSYDNSGYGKSSCVKYGVSNTTSDTEYADNMLITPEIHVGSDNVILSFYSEINQSSGKLLVYLSENGGRTFYQEPFITLEQCAWKRIEKKLPVPSTGSLTIGFKAVVEENKSTTYCNIKLDNVVVDYVPRCAAPLNLIATDVTNNSVSLSWSYSEFGDYGNQVDVVIMNGDVVYREYTDEFTESGGFVITGLDENTEYTIKVRMNCEDSYLGKSEWSAPLKVSTLCQSQNLPISYDFNNLSEVPDCWLVRRDAETVGNIVKISTTQKYGDTGKSIEIPYRSDSDNGTHIFTEPINHVSNDLEISLMAYNTGISEQTLEIGIQGNAYLSGTYCSLKEIHLEPLTWTPIVVYSNDIPLGRTKNASVVLWAKHTMNMTKIYIDNLLIDKMPGCRIPDEVKMTDFDSNWADFDWNIRENETLEVYNIDDGGQERLLATLTAGNKRVSLTENTAYTFRFKAKNAAGVQSDWGVDIIEFHTPCLPMTPPDYLAGFEDGSIPDCWYNQGLDFAYYNNIQHIEWTVNPVGTNTNMSVDGGLSKYVLATPSVPSGVKNVNLFMPYMNIPEENQYMVEFYIYREKNTNNSNINNVKVYVNSKRSIDGAELIGSIARQSNRNPVTNLTGWEKHEFVIPAKGNVYIIFESESNNKTVTYLDNISVKSKSSCMSPSNLRLGKVTATTATIEWTERSTPEEYRVSYTINGEQKHDVVRGDTKYVIKDLTPKTDYGLINVSVAAVCSESDISSTVVRNGIKLETLCEAKKLPYSGGIDDWDCYSVLANDGSSFPRANSAGYIALRRTNVFTLPEFDYESAQGHRLIFEYKSLDYSNLIVGTANEPSDWDEMNVVTTIPGTKEQKQYIVDFENTAGKYIIIKKEGESTELSYLYNIQVLKTPDCPEIEHITVGETTQNSVQINVSCPSMETFEVEYGEKGFVLGTGTKQTVNSNFTLTGLALDTHYDFYVRSVCDKGKGNYSEVQTFKTLCNPVDLSENSFSDSFEETDDLGCWISRGDTKWMIDKTSENAYQGLQYAQLACSGMNQYSDLYRSIDLKAGQTYEFLCYAKASAPGTENFYLSVAYCNANGENATDVLPKTLIDDNAGYQKYSTLFTPVADMTHIRVRGETNGKDRAIWLDNITVKRVTCPYPTNVIFNELSERKAVISWEQLMIKHYNVKVSSTEFVSPDQETGDIFDGQVTIADAGITLDDLQPNTTYYLYIQSVGMDDSKSRWTDATKFKTSCPSDLTVIAESFESGTPLDCWRWNDGNIVKISSGTAYDGTMACEVGATGKTSVLALPTLNVDNLRNKMLRMHIKSADKNPIDLTLGVTNMLLSPINVYPITKITVYEDDGWKEVLCYFSSLNAGAGEYANAKNIVISSSNKCYIDNVIVSDVPTCDQPINLKIKDLSDTYAVIDWMMYEEKACSVEVRINGEVAQSLSASTHPFRIENLSSNSIYEVEIWNQCGADKSESQRIKIITPCGPEYLPYRQNFDNVPSNNIPICWTDTSKAGPKHSQLTNKWEADDGVIEGIVMKYNGNYDNTKDNSSRLQTPVIDLTGETSAALSFYMQSKNGLSSMDVLVSVDGGKTFTDTIQSNLNYSVWTNVQCNLEKYCGQKIIIGFNGVSACKSNGYVYLDDVEIGMPRNCDAISSLAVNGVEGDKISVSITDEVGSAWEIAVDKAGFNPDTIKNPQLLTSKEGTVSGVPLSSVCEAYVRVKCSDGGYGAWSKPVRFISDCAATDLPFEQDMERISSAKDLACHYCSNSFITNVAAVEYADAISGNKSLRLKSSTTDYLVLPELNAAIEDIAFEFMYKYISGGSSSFEVGVVHKDSVTSVKTKFVSVFVIKPVFEATPVAFTFADSDRNGNDYRIAFKLASLSNKDNLVIDNVRIYHTNEITQPIEVRISDVTDQTAMANWKVPSETVYSEIMLNDDESNIIKVTDGATNYELTSLSANMSYSIKVRSIDGKGTATGWSIPAKFMTNNTPAAIPYRCNFETEDAIYSKLWKFTAQGDNQLLYWAVSDKDKSGVYEGEGGMYIANGSDTAHVYTEPVKSGANVLQQQVNACLTMNLKRATYRLSFRYHSESSDAKDFLKVALIPRFDGENVEEKEMVLTAKMYNVPEWTLYETEFYVPEPGFYKLALMWSSQSGTTKTTYKPAAIDSIVIEENPCPAILKITSDSIDATSAKVIWSDNNPDNVAYEYVLTSGSDIFDAGNAVPVQTGHRYVRLTDLVPATKYALYLRVTCGGDNNSEWSAVHNFTTTCAPDMVDGTKIYEDGFENYTEGDYGCWEQYFGKWKMNGSISGVVPSESSKSIAIAKNTKASLARRVYLKAGLNYQVRFKAAQSADASNSTLVKVSVGNEFGTIGVSEEVYEAKVTTKAYAEHIARFNVKEDGVYRIVLRGETSSTTQFLTVDEFKVITVDCDIPVKLAVTDLVGDKATVRWSGTANEYKIRVYWKDVLQDEKTVTGEEFILDGLYGASEYTVKMSSICNDGNESDIAEVNFSTSCDAALPMPYSETFDTKIPLCWTVQSESYAKWAYKKIDGNGVIWFNSKTGKKGDESLLISPEMKIEKTGYRLTFDYINPKGGPLDVMLSTDGGETYAETILSAAKNVNLWTTVSVSLDKYEGKNVTAVIKGTSNVSQDNDAYIYIDNFHVNKIGKVEIITDTVCYGQPYMEHGFEIPAVTKYGISKVQRLDMASNTDELDTLYEVTLYVPNTDYYIADVLIPGEVYTGNGFENGISEQGQDYTRTEMSSCGCDSVIHLRLKKMEIDVVIYDTVCGNTVYEFCDEILTESCTKTCVRTNAYGIDSTTTLHLTVLPTLVEQDITICQGDFVEFDGKKLTATGVYEADSTYTNSGKCTYTSRLNLTVVDSVSIKEETICEGNYVEIDGIRYTESGRHRIVLAPQFGCSRIMYLDLTVIPADTVTYHTDACEGKLLYYPGFAGKTVTRDTTMHRRDKTVSGCDSVTRLVVKYHETVEVFDTVYSEESVYTCKNGETLVNTGDCENVFQTHDGCDSIVHLHVVFKTGIDNISVQNLIITPNPAKASSVVYVDNEWNNAEINGMMAEVLDITGRVIYRNEVRKRPVTINVPAASGIYVIRITDGNNKVYIGKLIVE